MRKFSITIIAVFFVSVTSNGYSRTGNIGRSTVGSGSVPPSRGGSSLVETRRETNNSNLIVSGNVGGGRHFRGVVPYQSEWEFRGLQGSSSQNSSHP